MPYIKMEVDAGRTREVYKYFSARYGKPIAGRAMNAQETADKQRKTNERNAENRLRWLINANFGHNDMHVVLTYRPKRRPSPEQAKEELRRFIRRLRYLYTSKGATLKYIAVTEYRHNAIHHHIIINNCEADKSVCQSVILEEHRNTCPVSELWTNGKVLIRYLDDTGDYSKLAAYLIKETKNTFNVDDVSFNKRWYSSRNLTQPVITKEVVSADTWTQQPKPVKGYYIDTNSVYNGVDSFYGFPYQHYVMKRLE